MRNTLKSRYAVLAIGITLGLVQSSIGQSIFVDGSTTQWLQGPVANNMGMAAQGSLFTCREIADVCSSRELPDLSATESGYGFSQPLMMSYVPDVSEEGQLIELNLSVGRDIKTNLEPGQVVQTLLGNMTGNLINDGKMTVHEIVATAYADAASQTVASAATPIVLSAGDSFDFGPHIQFGNEAFSGPALRTDVSVVVEFDQVMAGQTRVDVRFPDKDFTAGTSSAPWYYAGDSNQNGKFCTDDLTLVFQNQKYKTTLHAFWQDGDWDGAPVPASAPNPRATNCSTRPTLLRHSRQGPTSKDALGRRR